LQERSIGGKRVNLAGDVADPSMSSYLSNMRKFDPGLDIHFDSQAFDFSFSSDEFGPAAAELRRLEDIRASLKDPQCNGPDPVYAIAMDVGRIADKAELERRKLLYGVVAYAKGKLGTEPVRSQGHIHAVAPHCGWSTPELVEIWEGKAIVYLQERVGEDAGRCMAIEAAPGELVVIPPAWAHCIMNADPEEEMVFGAFCDREYAFEYEEIRRRGGLAWFAQYRSGTQLEWNPNPAYTDSALEFRSARSYPELDLNPARPIYEQFTSDPNRFQWISEPAMHAEMWKHFEP
jgi:glucose-6-phosphate isomerase